MLGPEGLGRRDTADRHEAGGLSLQRGSDQLAAGCGQRRLHTDLMAGRPLILAHQTSVAQYFYELLVLDEQLTVMLSG